MENLHLSAKLYYLCPAFREWSDARVAEEARLESVYTSKAYPEFESRSLRKKGRQQLPLLFCFLFVSVAELPNTGQEGLLFMELFLGCDCSVLMDGNDDVKTVERCGGDTA